MSQFQPLPFGTFGPAPTQGPGGSWGSLSSNPGMQQQMGQMNPFMGGGSMFGGGYGLTPAQKAANYLKQNGPIENPISLDGPKGHGTPSGQGMGGFGTPLEGKAGFYAGPQESMGWDGFNTMLSAFGDPVGTATGIGIDKLGGLADKYIGGGGIASSLVGLLTNPVGTAINSIPNFWNAIKDGAGNYTMMDALRDSLGLSRGEEPSTLPGGPWGQSSANPPENFFDLPGFMQFSPLAPSSGGLPWNPGAVGDAYASAIGTGHNPSDIIQTIAEREAQERAAALDSQFNVGWDRRSEALNSGMSGFALLGNMLGGDVYNRYSADDGDHWSSGW